jgi:thymidine phosphorylase
MIGNTVELEESLAVLRGEGPSDVTELVLALSAELLRSTKAVGSDEEGRQRVRDVIQSGRGLEKLREVVAAQGGDLDAPRPVAPPSSAATADEAGYVAKVDGGAFGRAVVELGGGRRVMTDSLDRSVGVEMFVRIGDPVEAGQPLFRVFGNADATGRVELGLKAAVSVEDTPPIPRPLIAERFGPATRVT